MDSGFVRDYRNKRFAAYTRLTRWMEGHETIAKFGAAFLMAVLTGALAQISIQTPLSPVPYTMQVFGVALMGGLLGRVWGPVSALLYVGLGIIGLPVFAGQVETFQGVDWMSGATVFKTSLSSWYLIGFVAQAWIIGAIRDARNDERNTALIIAAPLAISGLIVFALLDAYYLSDYGALYQNSQFPNAWFALLCLGLLACLASALWLALTRKARRERIELFFGNVVGLLALYGIGAVGFYFVWKLLGYGPLDGDTLLAYAVLPFIPADLTKILLAVGLLTLVRPTNTEIQAKGASTKENVTNDV